jgi:hypothetical protein
MSKDYDEDNDLFRKEQIEKFYAESKLLREKYKPCELSDEEIEKVGRENLSYWDSYDEGLMLFARAILKKASEK